MNTLAHFTIKLTLDQQLLKTSTAQLPTIASLANPIHLFHYDKQNVSNMGEQNSQSEFYYSNDEDRSLFEQSSTDQEDYELSSESESFDIEDKSYLYTKGDSNINESGTELELSFTYPQNKAISLNANNSAKKRKASSLNDNSDFTQQQKKQKADNGLLSANKKEDSYYVNGQRLEVTPDKQNQFGRFAENPNKSGAYSNGVLIGTSSGSYEFGSYNTPEKKTPCQGVVTPNSKTPEYLSTPNGTKLTRVVAFRGSSLYMDSSKDKNVKVKKRLEFDSKTWDCYELDADEAVDNKGECEQLDQALYSKSEKLLEELASDIDSKAECEQLNKLLYSKSWKELKELADKKLTTEFELQPDFERKSGKRAKSQAQVMNNISAKDAVTKFLKTEHIGDPVSAAIDFIYSSFMGQANLLDDQGSIRARTLEYRHLAPFAVQGNKAQRKDNLAIGPSYTNTIEFCIELAIYEIVDQGVPLDVKVVEHVLGDMNIGLFRQYIITDKASRNCATVEFPTLCCAIKPPVIFKDFLKFDIQLKLGLIENLS